MGRLEIYLLGPLLVRLDSQPISHFDTEKTRALLAYLACESDRPHQREYLAEMLWPERPPGAARANLRHILRSLRQHLDDLPPPEDSTGGERFLLVTRDTLQLNLASAVWVDSAAFANFVKGTTPVGNLRIDQLEQAVKLYRGPFLEDISLTDSVEFQEWLLLRREGYYQAVLTGLRQLMDVYRLWGKYEQAKAYAWRQLELAPWNEDAHRNVMHLLAITGHRGAALAQYESCRLLLREQLEVEPGEETIQLYEQIRDGRLEAGQRSTPLAVGLDIRFHPPGFLSEVDSEATPDCIVAREGELATLNGYFQRMVRGQGGVVFVTGVAGQGKTALLSEFVRRSIAKQSDLLVALGSCNIYSGVGDPYVPFREILAMLTGDVESQWLSGTISRQHARRIWAALPNTIPELIASSAALVSTFLDGKELFSRAALSLPDRTDCLEQLRALIEQPPTGLLSQEQSFLFEHYSNFLFNIAQRHPLVLILDDLQWADSASVGLLFHLGRRLARENQRVMIACAYRPEEVAAGHAGGRHPLAKVLNELTLIFGENRLNLDPGKLGEGRRFVDEMLDAEPNQLGEAFRADLFRHTQGHPLFTVELLRAMQERGEVVKNQAGEWIAEPALDWERLPARVQAVIAERIDRLTPELRQILNLASVEGEVFTAQVLTSVYQTEETLLLSQLAQELGKRHRLVREEGETQTARGRVSRFRFRHFLFQDYVYKQLSPGERRLYHKDVAIAMESIYQGQHDEMAVQLAHHFYQAGENQQAYAYSIVAARRAARLHASDEAIQHTTRAIEIAPQISASRIELSDLHRERGLAYVTLGKFDQGQVDLETSCRIAEQENERRLESYALIELGRLWASKNYTQSYHYYEHALELARELDDQEILASCLNWMGNWLANAERPADAIRYHREALDIFTRSGDQEEMAKTLDLLGIASLLGADSVHSTAFYDQAITLFRELDDRASLASSLLGRGSNGGVYITSTIFPAHDMNAARRDFEEARAIAREIGLPAAETWADWSQGLVEVGLGNFQTALDLIEHGSKLAIEMDHGEWIVGCQAALGIVYLDLCALDQAYTQLSQALNLAEKLQSKHWFNNVTGNLATVYLRLGKLSHAYSTLAAVITPQTSMDAMHIRMCWARRAELALAQGDPGLALEITDRLIDSAPGLPPGGVITFLWRLKGEVLAALGDLVGATAWLRQARENARQTGERSLGWQIHASLVELYYRMDCPDDLQAELSQAEALIKELAAPLRDEVLKYNFLTHAREKLGSFS